MLTDILSLDTQTNLMSSKNDGLMHAYCGSPILPARWLNGTKNPCKTSFAAAILERMDVLQGHFFYMQKIGTSGPRQVPRLGLREGNV